MFCLLQAGIGSEEEGAQDSTLDALGGSMRFGVYEIDCHADGSFCELGRGAMGVTYRATDTSLQRKVALKIIKIDIAERSADARERFVREARAAAALRHEHIATVYQFGMRLETGQYFYAMELIEGETLDERVHRAGPLDSRTTIGIAEQVTSALAAAEKHGLVHRDLKPANLMLINADDPEVMGSDQARSKRSKIRALRKSGIPVIKIIDFGLAKAFHTATDPKSLTHDRFVGTPAFASPEQFEHSALDVRSDIYSLGETLWFALTGKTPFAGHTLSEIHRAQKSNRLPVEQFKGAHVPHRLKSLLESMLAFEPASRPGTHELAARLRRCSPEVRSVRRTRAALAVATAVVFGMSTLFLAHRSGVENAALNPAADKSIAVLPFENLSPDPENVYFVDGVQDEILTLLASLADLKVINRTSVMQYESRAARDLNKIGHQLGVARVVEGSVQRAGNRVRVNAQLIDVSTNRTLWGQSYDRDVADVFAIQSEIAEQIVSQLKSKLSPREKAAIDVRLTRDLEAFDFYLQAKQLINTFHETPDRKETLLKALRLLDEAISRDPNFTLAYCWAARANEALYWFGFDATPGRLAQAKVMAQKALALDPESGEAHLAQARVYYRGDRDYARARAELAIAKKLLPNSAEVYSVTGWIDRRQGRWEDAVKNLEKAAELDPRNSQVFNDLTVLYDVLRRYDDEEAVCDRAIAANPGSTTYYQMVRAQVELAKGNTQAAHRLLDSLPAGYDPDGAATSTRVSLALYERDASSAAKILAQSKLEELADNTGSLLPRDWFRALAARANGDAPTARDAFSATRVKTEAKEHDRPNDADLLAFLGLLDAGLARGSEALAEGRRAVELQPISEDALKGVYIITKLAMIYAWLGDNDAAIERLTFLAKTPGGPDYGQLKLDPAWDGLRDDTRFVKIVEGLKPHSVRR